MNKLAKYLFAESQDRISIYFVETSKPFNVDVMQDLLHINVKGAAITMLKHETSKGSINHVQEKNGLRRQIHIMVQYPKDSLEDLKKEVTSVLKKHKFIDIKFSKEILTIENKIVKDNKVVA